MAEQKAKWYIVDAFSHNGLLWQTYAVLARRKEWAIEVAREAWFEEHGPPLGFKPKAGFWNVNGVYDEANHPAVQTAVRLVDVATREPDAPTSLDDHDGVAGITRLVAFMDGRVEVERVWLGRRETVVCANSDAAIQATVRSLAGDTL